MPDEMDRIQERVLNEQLALEARARERCTVLAAQQRSGDVLCVCCGDVIDPRRVNAMVGVRTCIRCAERLERRRYG